MASHIIKLFFDLIQISIGSKDRFQNIPVDEEWQELYDLAQKQSLAGVLLKGVDKTLNTFPDSKPSILFKWICIQQYTLAQNKLHNEKAKELCEWFARGGFRSCVLKGQGTALYYEQPECRQCGDIDIWVEGDRDVILEFIRQHEYIIESVDIKHSDVHFYDDVPVEVHFLPSWMYCPSTNIKLQKYISDSSDRQFSNKDDICGFTHTTIAFDLVYSMVHIFRHIFSEGIGLRQLMDYYYILLSSNEEQRATAYDVLCDLRLRSFAGGIMWILQNIFGIKKEYLLCPVNERHGEFLLSEILTAGNFGHYDNRMKQIDHNKRFTRGIVQFKKNLRFVGYYPSEVLWSPLWKLWHWGWRKCKGYL